MKNIFYFFLLVVSVLILSACLEQDYEIKVVKAKGWTDLMPGAGGKTYILIQIELRSAKNVEPKINSIIIKSEYERIKLVKEDFSSSIKQGEDFFDMEIKAPFFLKQKNTTIVDAEIEFGSGADTYVYKINNIALEKVY